MHISPPNITPGTIGQVIWIHGPNAFSQDLSLTKSVPLRKELSLKLQGEFLNAWNHPIFGNVPNITAPYASFDPGVQDNTLRAGVCDEFSTSYRAPREYRVLTGCSRGSPLPTAGCRTASGYSFNDEYLRDPAHFTC